MLYPITGCDANGEVCTTTSLDVTAISQKEYDDPEIEAQIAAFENGKIDYLRLNREAVGLARSHGGESEEKGLWLHNRIFMADENPIEQLQLTTTANTAEHLSLVRLPAGARIAAGPIAGGQGTQVRISRSDLKATTFEAWPG